MPVAQDVFVTPPPRAVDDPAAFPAAMEQHLATALLTWERGQGTYSITLCPESARALRDALRAGRKVREAARQLEAIQADLGHRLQERERALARELKIWIVAAVCVWGWAIWVTWS